MCHLRPGEDLRAELKDTLKPEVCPAAGTLESVISCTSHLAWKQPAPGARRRWPDWLQPACLVDCYTAGLPDQHVPCPWLMCLQELEALLASAHRPNYVVQVRG